MKNSFTIRENLNIKLNQTQTDLEVITEELNQLRECKKSYIKKSRERQEVLMDVFKYLLDNELSCTHEAHTLIGRIKDVID